MGRKQTLGVTLVEMFLVIIIGGAIIVMGVQQSFYWRHYADVQQVRNTVNSIMLGMGLYFHANCGGNYDPSSGAMAPNSLSPAAFGTLPNTIALNLKDDLVSAGFVNVTEPLNPLLVQTGHDWTTGFVVQFNLSTQDRYACTQGSGTVYGTTAAGNCSSTEKVGTIVVWIPQVAVAIKASTVALARTYLNELGGDCLSTADSSGLVTPCTSGSIGSGNYVVFSHHPSFVSRDITPTSWELKPMVAQFGQMYTTYQINYLLDSSGATVSGTQYYICGS